MKFGLTIKPGATKNIWYHKAISQRWPCGTMVWRAKFYASNNTMSSLGEDTVPLFGHRDKGVIRS